MTEKHINAVYYCCYYYLEYRKVLAHAAEVGNPAQKLLQLYLGLGGNNKDNCEDLSLESSTSLN